MTVEGGKAGFVVFAIKPLFMPTLERGFQWKIEEIMVRMNLDANITDDLSLGSDTLVFQEEVMFEKREIRKDDEISLTQMDKNDNLNDIVWIQMKQLDLVVVKKVVKEFAGGETESALEGGEHHNFVGVGSRNVFILCRSPLEDDMGGEKVILDKLEELALIDGGSPEHLQMGGGHGD
jgi:hypothetical protein